MPDADTKLGRDPGAWLLSWWAVVGAGLLSGLLTVLAFPPVGVWPLAPLAIAPLALVGIAAGRGPSRRLRVAILIVVGLLPARFFEERWLIEVTPVGYPLLAAYMASFGGAFAWMLAIVVRAIPRAPACVVVPILWVGLEVLRGEVLLTGYAWFLVGHPLIEWPALAAPAAVAGAYFVSFLVAALVGAGIDAIGLSGGSARIGGLCAGAVVVAWVGIGAWGWHQGRPAEGGRVAQLAVVQTNVPTDNKLGWTLGSRLQDFARFCELTRLAAPAADVIIWPETMFPVDGLNPEALRVMHEGGLGWEGESPGEPFTPMAAFADVLLKFQKSLGVPMIVGATRIEGMRIEREAGALRVRHRAKFNSAVLLDDGAISASTYDKMRLTPFGEMIPYVWRWPALQNWVLGIGARGMEFTLASGRSPEVIRFRIRPGGEEVSLATPICFEVTRSSLCRLLAYENGRPRVDALVNLSNDGWFGSAWGGREQHLQVARWRCVELGLPMVRSVNTGISADIDSHGTLVKQGPDGADSPAFTDGVLNATVPIGVEHRGTVFGRIGNLFAWVTLVGAAGLWGYGLTSGWRARRGGRNKP
ncbi:MAG: apolipoprotein N-acyltransferase [Phycisphaeraceae bacterium]|nr:apolipoprotein N-acyltransferase [Phycisphaeraceae bacterium]